MHNIDKLVFFMAEWFYEIMSIFPLIMDKVGYISIFPQGKIMIFHFFLFLSNDGFEFLWFTSSYVSLDINLSWRQPNNQRDWT